ARTLCQVVGHADAPGRPTASARFRCCAYLTRARDGGCPASPGAGMGTANLRPAVGLVTVRLCGSGTASILFLLTTVHVRPRCDRIAFAFPLLTAETGD